MDSPLKTFALALLGHWWELMGCAAFTILGVFIAQSGKSNAWLVSASAVLAVALFVVAAYRTWKPEHEKRCALQAELDAEADMHGTIWIWPGDSGTRTEGRLQFKCDCSNHGRKACQITRIFFDVNRDTKFRFELPLYEPGVKVVEHARQYQESGQVYVPNTTAITLAQSAITAGLIDSLGNEYLANIKTIAKVPFSIADVLGPAKKSGPEIQGDYFNLTVLGRNAGGKIPVCISVEVVNISEIRSSLKFIRIKIRTGDGIEETAEGRPYVTNSPVVLERGIQQAASTSVYLDAKNGSIIDYQVYAVDSFDGEHRLRNRDNLQPFASPEVEL